MGQPWTDRFKRPYTPSYAKRQLSFPHTYIKAILLVSTNLSHSSSWSITTMRFLLSCTFAPWAPVPNVLNETRITKAAWAYTTQQIDYLVEENIEFIFASFSAYMSDTFLLLVIDYSCATDGYNWKNPINMEISISYNSNGHFALISHFSSSFEAFVWNEPKIM